MVFSQLQLASLYYLELYRIVLQNCTLCETLQQQKQQQQQQQQQQKNR